LDEFQVFAGVEIFLIRLWIKVQLALGAVISQVVVFRQLWVELLVEAQAKGSLVGPAPGDIFDCVAAAPEH